MNRHIIRLTSVTYAMRAQKLLEQQGYRVWVKKLAKNAQVHGCGYGVELTGDLQHAVQILNLAGIRIVEVVEGARI